VEQDLDAQELYGQAAERELLALLAPHVQTRAAIDVGAERGELAAALREDGWAPLHLLEPDPAAATHLRRAFEDDPEVEVHELAAGAEDGRATLRLARATDGSPVGAFNTTLALTPGTDLHWSDEVAVAERSLDSLAADGEIPPEVGLLKIDTEGADDAVLAGATTLRAEIVMVEHWTELPGTLGPCPWTLERMVELVAPLGPTHFVCVHHGDLHTTLEVDRAEVPPGEWSNLIFVADALRDALDAALAPVRARLEAQLLERAEHYRRVSEERLTVLEELERAAVERLEMIETGERRRAELEQELAAQRATAAERERELEEARLLRDRIAWLEASGATGRGPLAALARSEAALLRRARELTAPRLGVLRQQAPGPVHVPRRALRLRPPARAPTISLVTPSYNQGRYIERTVRSVLAQGYPALEYIVQDGGSVDGTVPVLERYRDRLAGLAIEPDAGQADAINRAFARTGGEVMGWINSDDMLLPGALAAVARHFAAHPETDVVYGHRIMIDEEDRQIGCWIMPPHEDWALERAGLIPQETMFWRRRIWDAAGGRLDDRYRYALDWELQLRFMDAGARIVRLPLPLGAFRVHFEQKTTSDLHIGLDESARIRAQRGRAPESHVEAWRELRPYLRRHVARHTMYRMAMRIAPLRAEVDLTALGGRSAAPRRLSRP
jgi:FkbM family methyltransferase